MALVDISTLQSIATGQPFLAATLQQIRDNQEFFADPPSCSVYASSAQSVNDSTVTTLTADSENFDNDSMHSTSSNTSRITIQTAGRYLLMATLSFAADADGKRNALFLIDGTTSLNGLAIPTASAGSTVITAVRAQVFTAGQYVECRAQHTAGAALNVTMEEFAAFWMTR